MELPYKAKNPAAVALGSMKSERKAASSKANGVEWEKPHHRKVDYFLSIYPHELESNERIIKWPMTINGKATTYNPDYTCATCGDFIEITTSYPNVSAQGPKWYEALRLGHPLRVFWWEGQEITDLIRKDESVYQWLRANSPSAIARHPRKVTPQ